MRSFFTHHIHVYNMSYKVNIVSSRSAVMSTMFYWLVRPLRRGLLYYRLKHQPERERMSEVVVINHQIKWHFSAVTLLSADVKTHNTVYCVGLKATTTTILSWKLRRPFISMKHKAVILPLCDTCISIESHLVQGGGTSLSRCALLFDICYTYEKSVSSSYL